MGKREEKRREKKRVLHLSWAGLGCSSLPSFSKLKSKPKPKPKPTYHFASRPVTALSSTSTPTTPGLGPGLGPGPGPGPSIHPPVPNSFFSDIQSQQLSIIASPCFFATGACSSTSIAALPRPASCTFEPCIGRFALICLALPCLALLDALTPTVQVTARVAHQATPSSVPHLRLFSARDDNLCLTTSNHLWIYRHSHLVSLNAVHPLFSPPSPLRSVGCLGHFLSYETRSFFSLLTL